MGNSTKDHFGEIFWSLKHKHQFKYFDECIIEDYRTNMYLKLEKWSQQVLEDSGYYNEFYGLDTKCCKYLNSDCIMLTLSYIENEIGSLCSN